MNRVADLALALGVCPVAAPLALAAAVGVRVLDGGPMFFTQVRAGKNRRPFRIVKLRTMRDGRITGVGRFLRATGLDELPQIVNVLRGEMSLVGPRPLTKEDVRRLGWDGPRYDERWSVRPGIVGPAQLRAAVRCHPRVTWVHDRAYARRSSVLGDLALVTGAVLCAFAGKSRAQRFIRCIAWGRR